MIDTYEEALVRGKKTGAARCDDSALMTLFCDAPLQTLVGAVSTELVWEGARKRELGSKDLAKLCHDDPMEAAELMWL